MSFPRFSSKPKALLALASLGLAAVLVGGCAAPDSDERASFTTVQGRVVDANGNPVQGAVINAVGGTFNLPGQLPRQVATTDAQGRFFIDAVPDSPGNPAVLRLVATGNGLSGVVSGTVAQLANPVVNVRGQAVTLVPGTQTTDIIPGVVEGAVAVLVPPIAQNFATLQPGQATTIPLLDPVLGNITITVPAGAVNEQVGVTASILSPLALPAPAPGVGTGLAPGGTVTAQVPLTAIEVSTLSGERLDLAQPATITVPIPAGAFTDGQQVPLFLFNEATGAWDQETTGIVSGGGTLITYQVNHFSVRIVPLTVIFSMDTLPAADATINYPAVTSLPNGYTGLLPNINGEVNTSAPQQTLVWQGVGGDGVAILNRAFQSVTGQVGTGAQFVTVPNATTSVTCRRFSNVGITAQIVVGGTTLETANGLRTFWVCQHNPAVAPVANPTHLQGHAQAIAVGF